MEKQNTEDFLKLLVEDITTSVNKTDAQTQQYRRKVVELPSIDDISKLNTYLTQKRTIELEEIQNKFSYYTWLTLAETTLTLAQLFNRRAGEIERIFIGDFNAYQSISNDMLKSLSPDSVKVAKNYIRFEIRGKLNRTVPVLLPRNLTKYREQAGISPENIYFWYSWSFTL